MSTTGAIVGQKMEVVTRNLDASRCIRKPESNHGAHRLLYHPVRLMSHDVSQWWVGRNLTSNRPESEIPEHAGYPYGADRHTVIDEGISPSGQASQIEWSFDLIGNIRCEVTHHGKGRERLKGFTAN